MAYQNMDDFAKAHNWPREPDHQIPLPFFELTPEQIKSFPPETWIALGEQWVSDAQYAIQHGVYPSGILSVSRAVAKARLKSAKVELKAIKQAIHAGNLYEFLTSCSDNWQKRLAEARAKIETNP